MSSVYSIKELEKLSGIKAHTLRIWEKRYGIIKPKRTANNIRYYLDDDIKRVLNIALLNKNGHKISKIACMCNTEINKAVQDLSILNGVEAGNEIEAMTISILELDASRCKVILNTVIEKKGFEACIYDLIYPLLDKLSAMWFSGSFKAVHESFIRNILRNKVCAEIDQLENIKNPKCSFILFLSENEDHELSLLFLHYILKTRDVQIINLGRNVAVYDIIQACEIYKPDYTFSIINDTFVEDSLQSYIDFLSQHIPDVTMLFSGFQFVKQDIKMGNNCKYIESLNAVESII